MGTEKDYEEHMKIIEAVFNSIQTPDSKKEKLKKSIRHLLSEVLRCKPEERPKMKDLIHKMKKFEKRKKYPQTEIEH